MSAFVDKKELKMLRKKVLGEKIESKKPEDRIDLKKDECYYLITYELKGMSQSKKVMFSFAFFGRKDGKGLIAEVKGKKLGSGCIMVPEKNIKKVEKFLNFWGITYKKIKVRVVG